MALPPPVGTPLAAGLDLNTASSPVNRSLDRTPLLGLSRRKLNALRQPVCYIDGEQRYRLANDGYAELLGRLPEQVVGHTVRAVLGEAEYARLRPHLESALAGAAGGLEHEWPGPDGRHRWLRTELFPDRASGGDVRGVISVCADIDRIKRLEIAAVERERQLAQFTDQIPGPVVYLDAELRFRFVNRSWLEWSGKQRAEVMARPFGEVVGPELAAYFAERFREAESGTTVDYEQAFARMGGGRRWMRGRIVPDLDQARGVRGYYLTAHDVSDLKLARDALLLREGQLRSIMDGIPAPVAYLGRDERYRFINLAFSRYFGVPRSAARELTMRQIVGESDYPAERKLFERALAGHATGHDRLIASFDQRSRWMNVRLVPDLSASGDVHGVFVLMSDVDDLKNAQEALSASEARLRLIIDNVPSRIAYVDRDLSVRFANRHSLAWLRREEIGPAGEPLAKVIGADRMEVMTPLYERVLAGETVSVERAMPQHGGGSRWEELHMAPHCDRAGEVVGVYTVVTDVHDAKVNEEALRRANWMLSSHIDNTPLAVIEWDRDFRVAHWSPQAEKIFGWMSPEVIGLKLEDWRLIHEDDREAVDVVLDGLTSGRQPRSTIINRNYRKDGRVIWVEWYNSCLHDDEGRLVSILSFAQDVSSRIESEERLQHVATHDSLTGLPNRVLLQERLTRGIARARRAGRRVAILFLDLDRFKNVNDSLGHRVGDLLLQQIGHRLEDSIRATDTLARLGGDEFIVVIDQFDDPEVPGAVAVKLLDTIAQPLHIEDHEIYVTASVGISMFPDDGGDGDELFKNADVAMYRAKETGKNTVQFFSPDMAAHRLKQHTIEVALRTAIKEGGLFLHYQPVVRLADERIVGVEALIRWQHPERGLIPPHSFIPPAEESGLIHILGDWVLREACRQAVAWRRAGMPLTVSVNLSAKQFFQEDLANRIERTILSEDCEPTWIKLEVTETSLLQDLEMIRRVLSRLRGFGVGVAIDDFGTGYSSLSHLKHFPIDTLKIDLSFIADLNRDRGDAAITEAIIGMGNGLGLEVIAEGVETREQLDFLRARGCGYGQGNLFSRPRPAGELASVLAEAVGRFDSTSAGQAPEPEPDAPTPGT